MFCIQVRDLILRLEDDRMQTLLALESENEKVTSLGEKIDRMCQKRLTVLPLAVQKGGVMDISYKLCDDLYDIEHLRFLLTDESNIVHNTTRPATTAQYITEKK